MEAATLIAVLSLLVAACSFVAGRQNAGQVAGKELGKLSTDIHYIRASIDRIEGRLEEDVRTLENRIDQLSRDTGEAMTVAVRAEAAAGSAHRLIEELL